MSKPSARAAASPQTGSAGEAAWIALMRAAPAVRARIEGELEGAGLPPLEWYDVLLELDRADGGRLRQSALGERLLLEKYNLSRRLDRMEAAGLVARRPCPEDARGVDVSITPAGRATRRAMWPAYAAAIRKHVAERLSERDAARLAALLRKLIQDTPSS
jgi:DNA-binding MarR family transcriptional regulator